MFFVIAAPIILAMYLAGLGMILGSIIIVFQTGKDSDGKPKPRNWPLIWLLFWLGLFFIRLSKAIGVLMVDLVGVGKFKYAKQAFQFASSAMQTGDNEETNRLKSTIKNPLVQVLFPLFLGIAGHFGIKRLENEIALRKGLPVPHP